MGRKRPLPGLGVRCIVAAYAGRVDSNPYGVVIASRNKVYIADAGAILEVSLRTGEDDELFVTHDIFPPEGSPPNGKVSKIALDD